MNIGQGKAERMKWCPKPNGHRAREGQKDEVVSEVE
ncbi:hypothetical protein JOC76_003311 [Neobacillus cucumis]|nr:hypothetical protein [Neobacillus cucumis]